MYIGPITVNVYVRIVLRRFFTKQIDRVSMRDIHLSNELLLNLSKCKSMFTLILAIPYTFRVTRVFKAFIQDIISQISISAILLKYMIYIGPVCIHVKALF